MQNVTDMPAADIPQPKHEHQRITNTPVADIPLPNGEHHTQRVWFTLSAADVSVGKVYKSLRFPRGQPDDHWGSTLAVNPLVQSISLLLRKKNFVN